MTRIPIVTFATGYDATAVEIDSGLFEAAERALLEEQRRQALLVNEAPAEKAVPTTRRIVGMIGMKAAGWF